MNFFFNFKNWIVTAVLVFAPPVITLTLTFTPGAAGGGGNPGAPGPIAGIGIPMLAAACGYLYYRSRRSVAVTA